MMTYCKVGEYVTAEPFHPFRIKMASGDTYEIRHPEMISVGRSSVQTYTDDDSANGSRKHDVSLLLMKALEPIEITEIGAGKTSQ